MYERFVKLLQERNVTPYQISKETGISQTTFSAWKKGRSVPKSDTLQKIADYFGVTTDYLLGREERTEDDELTSYLEELKTRPELKMMFQLAKGATKEDVERAVRIIEALLKDK